uniref:(northern house mosquito) hypothetical protein n=1 Tax=Culex pipiens TaxID=7175 RepID=A0A8D8D5D6_CULPI
MLEGFLCRIRAHEPQEESTHCKRVVLRVRDLQSAVQKPTEFEATPGASHGPRVLLRALWQKVQNANKPQIARVPRARRVRERGRPSRSSDPLHSVRQNAQRNECV